jgi:hypothetical protein
MKEDIVVLLIYLFVSLYYVCFLTVDLILIVDNQLDNELPAIFRYRTRKICLCHLTIW